MCHGKEDSGLLAVLGDCGMGGSKPAQVVEGRRMGVCHHRDARQGDAAANSSWARRTTHRSTRTMYDVGT